MQQKNLKDFCYFFIININMALPGTFRPPPRILLPRRTPENNK